MALISSRRCVQRPHGGRWTLAREGESVPRELANATNQGFCPPPELFFTTDQHTPMPIPKPRASAGRRQSRAGQSRDTCPALTPGAESAPSCAPGWRIGEKSFPRENWNAGAGRRWRGSQRGEPLRWPGLRLRQCAPSPAGFSALPQGPFRFSLLS